MPAPEVLRYTAFTADGRGGNPAGVVLDASAMSDAEMLAVAAELGYSETAFVTEPLDAAGRRPGPLLRPAAGGAVLRSRDGRHRGRTGRTRAPPEIVLQTNCWAGTGAHRGHPGTALAPS